MHRYRAYGLALHSEIPLPELSPGSSDQPDITIRIGAVSREPAPTDPATFAYYASPDEVCFHWEIVGAFQVRAGREIIVQPVAGVEDALLRLPLLGSVFGVCLHQRGLLVLHASAIDIHGSASIFLGTKGQGKSTTAATLYGRGHPLLADDIVALDMAQPERPCVLPGFPQLKLFDDAAASSLGDDPAQLPRLASVIEKRARRAPDGFPTEPLPPNALYVLADGPALAIDRLSPQDAICELLGSTIAGRFGRALLDGIDAVTHFQRCVNLLRCAPLYRLSRPRDLALLGGVADAVERQARTPAAARP
ncbi:MAG: serine kinase [Chloroflexota bacterium]